jgi:predicted ester cyclase
MILGLRAAFPDLRIDEAALVAEGRLVAARWTASRICCSAVSLSGNACARG